MPTGWRGQDSVEAQARLLSGHVAAGGYVQFGSRLGLPAAADDSSKKTRSRSRQRVTPQRPREGSTALFLGMRENRGRHGGTEGAPTLLTIEEVAAMLNVGPRFVRRLVAERRIAFHKVGHYVRFDVVDVAAWIAAGPRLDNHWRTAKTLRHAYDPVTLFPCHRDRGRDRRGTSRL